MNPRARSAPKFRERIETLTIALTVVRFRPTMFVFIFFVFQKVEVEDFYTWPFKLTQNMVQKNNDKIKKDPDKVPTLAARKIPLRNPRFLEASPDQKEKSECPSVRPVMTQRRPEPRIFLSRTPAARKAVPSLTS